VKKTITFGHLLHQNVNIMLSKGHPSLINQHFQENQITGFACDIPKIAPGRSYNCGGLG
jgi:hypothetical protein